MTRRTADRSRRSHPEKPHGRFRRARGLVAYWGASGLVCFDCASGRRFAVSPEVLRFLDALDDWTTVAALTTSLARSGNALDVAGSVRSLAKMGLIERADTARDWPWAPWMPEAAFFHFGTRTGRFYDDPREHDAELRARSARTPSPPPTKTVDGPRLALPAPQSLGAWSDTLKARRTWRNFSSAPVALAPLATLLQLTWGVQRRGTVEGQGAVVLKTSPSGGARHPIEAYVLASNVEGLPARAFHYDAASHELVDLGRTVSPEAIERLLGNQDYYRDAAVVVVMTAVIARSTWKYPRSRAYRVVLADAGHLGQTFCLTATALGLAPFCTMAFRESETEALIGVDGVSECAMYIVGVGSRAPEHAARPGRIHARRTP